MANDKRPAPTRRTGARVTPKGGPTARKGPRAAAHHEASGPAPSTRYTPPASRDALPSPAWLPWLMLALFVLGVAVIFLHYAETLLPAASSNWWLFGGLGFILGGIITATRYR